MTMPPYPPQPPPGPYAYGPAQREHPQGTTILVLGILSLVICGILGPVAWVMGSNALAEIDRNPTVYGNRGSVAAGRICGIIATCLLILSILFVGLLIAAG
ncbi:MAG: DUF4190 domain-containing protein [Acidimicrobiales bacterium]